jgi:hypothetical protein
MYIHTSRIPLGKKRLKVYKDLVNCAPVYKDLMNCAPVYKDLMNCAPVLIWFRCQVGHQHQLDKPLGSRLQSNNEELNVSDGSSSESGLPDFS